MIDEMLSRARTASRVLFKFPGQIHCYLLVAMSLYHPMRLLSK